MLLESEPATREPAWDDLGPLHICDTCVAWSFYGVANNGSGAVPNKPIPHVGLHCPDL